MRVGNRMLTVLKGEKGMKSDWCARRNAAWIAVIRRQPVRPFIASAVLVGLLSGCGVGGSEFLAGEYSGAIPCTLDVTNPSDETGSEEFDSAITLVVDDNGDITLNGVELVVGNEILFSIPTADLSFEIVDVQRSSGELVVTYEPRPTLPGITIEGELTQTFRANGDTIDVTSEAELAATDVSGESEFVIDCAGSLDAS